MGLHWKRLGQILTGHRIDEVRCSHATYPTPLVLSNETVRVFFATRDIENRSSISTVDVSLRDLSVQNLSLEPLLSPGSTGHFDDSGVTPGCLYKREGKVFLLYMGWNLGVTVPFRNSIGIAEYHESSNRLKRLSNAPFFDRAHEDPVNITYPFLLRDSSKYCLWYGSDLESRKDKEGMKHVIKKASSADLLHWERSMEPEIGLSHGELTVSRPTALFRGNRGYMFYSHREPGGEYTPGMAFSTDGKRWERRDDAMFWVGDAGDWESHGQCYPYIFCVNSRILMLYAGNRFGKAGFGIAELDGGEEALSSLR